MNCAFDKEKLSGYYDGELDAAEKAEVERHIASCSECLRELGELKSAAILVKELPRLRAPRSIAEGVKKEIQSAGRVHSFARVRRTLMWAASAAAVLFIGLNLIYFTSKPEPDASSVASKPVSAAPVLGRAAPPVADPAPEAMKDREEARRQAAPEQERLRQGEARKNEQADQDRKLDAAPLAKGEPMREKAFAGKSVEKKPTAVTEPPALPPAPAPARPAEPAKPAPTPPAAAPPPAPAATPRPEAKEAPKPTLPTEAPADKMVKKEADAPAETKQKSAEAGAAAVPAADPGPMHLTLASTQMMKSRTEMQEALKRMGYTLLPPPSAAMVKGIARSGQREETAYTFELTDAQIAKLRAELEKPGTSTLVSAKPEDPVMAQYKRGGMFEAKKDVASGGAAAPAKVAEAPKDREAKPAEEAPAAKSLAEGAEKSGEPRRKVVLHFLEVPYIPDRMPASDALKK